jgi:hypothetical protein
MKKIFIATPMYGGNCKAVYTHSLIFLISALRDNGYEITYDFTMNESLITRARNTLVHKFLQTDCDGLLFIDSDQGFDYNDVIKMIESGKDIISAVVPMKQINWEAAMIAYEFGLNDLEKYAGHYAVNFKKSTDSIPLNEPIEVDNIGTGLMYISRKVFEDMAPTCRSYLNSEEGTGVMQKDAKKVIEFFALDIDDKDVLLSEDFYFCRKWRALGNEVYAAPWVYVTHSGEQIFKSQFKDTASLYSKKLEVELENKD